MIDQNLGVSFQARSILALLQSFAELEEEKYHWLKSTAWYNGRECGICLSFWNQDDKIQLVITFGECRNSDHIFVDTWKMVVDTWKMVPFPINPPTVVDFPEEDYDRRTIFEWGEVAKASNHILELLKNHAK